MNVNVDVRIGKVTDVNKKKRLVRVKFEDTGITSGWLPVMQHYKAIVYTEEAGLHDHQFTHPAPYPLKILNTTAPACAASEASRYSDMSESSDSSFALTTVMTFPI